MDSDPGSRSNLIRANVGTQGVALVLPEGAPVSDPSGQVIGRVVSTDPLTGHVTMQIEDSKVYEWLKTKFYS